MYNEQRVGNTIGKLYIVEVQDMNRMGDCKWLPKPGTLCLCTDHSGDCFNDYIPIKIMYTNVSDLVFLKWSPRKIFGAYVFGKPSKYRLSCRNFHLLLAGETISLRVKHANI